MGSKSHQRRDQDLLRQAQRSFDKRDYKQALKDSRVLYRQQASPEARRILERAHLARAKELERMGLQPQARDVVNELLSLGVTDADVHLQLPEVMFSLGMSQGKLPQELSPEAAARVTNAAADRALVKSQPWDAVRAELRDGVQAVRLAIRALEEGDEAKATELLKDVPRSSPFSEWKLFARGLAAYYRKDADELRANWDRLDASAAPAQIAAALRPLAEPAEGPASSTLDRVSRLLPGGSALPVLTELQRQMSRDDPDGAVQALRRGRMELQGLDGDLRERVGLILCAWATRAGSLPLLQDVTRVSGPPALDPAWYRAYAMFQERNDAQELDLPDALWRNYIASLSGVAALSEGERNLAESLVWQRMGRHYVDCAEEPESPEEFQHLQREAVECYRNCIEKTPSLLDAYRELANVQRSWNREKAAARTLDELLKQSPDDVPALAELRDYEMTLGNPLRARELALHVQSLRPLDAEASRAAWLSHLRLARHFAIAKDWDAGRAAFVEAARTATDDLSRLLLLPRQAVLELKAGEDESAAAFIEQAKAVCPEPAPALLVLTVEGTRYQLPMPIRRKLNDEWQAELKKPARGATAGRMAELFYPYLSPPSYPGRDKHRKALLAYFRKAATVSLEPEDLLHICDLLWFVEHKTLLAKYVAKGKRLLPRHPLILFFAGELEIWKGPRRCSRYQAKRSFEGALAALKRGTAQGMDERRRKLVETESRNRLEFLEHVTPPPVWDVGGFDRFAGFSDQELEEMIDRTAKEVGVDPKTAKGKLLDELKDVLGGMAGRSAK